MLTWDSMVRDYMILLTALTRRGVDVSKYGDVTKSLANITIKVDGKYVQKSPDKAKRDGDFEKLRRMNVSLMLKLEAAKASGKSTVSVSELGALPPGLKLPEDKSSKSKAAAVAPLFTFPKIGPLAKMAILGAGTLAVLWLATRMRKPQPTMDERRRDVIRERVVKRIPLVRKEIVQPEPREEYVVEEVVQEEPAPAPPAVQTVVPQEEI